MVKLTILLVVFLLATGNITTLKILTENNHQNSPNEYQQVVKILNMCFQNTFKTIIASFKSDEHVMNFSKELPDIPIILLNNSVSVFNQKWLFSSAPIYVLETNSDEDLGTTLTSLRFFPWWNIESLFFLVGSSNNSCTDAKKILNTAWTRKILSTIYVCHDNKEKIYKIYTFNPFTNRAPEPWKLAENNSSGRWTLYEQLFQKNKNICPNLMFDKTNHLDGYEVKSILTYQLNDGKIRNASLDTWTSTMPVPSGSLIIDISKLLNISILVEEDKGSVVSNNYFSEPLLKLKTNKYDIYLNIRPIFLSYPHKTQPIFRMAMNIFTQKRPFLSPEEKISMYYFQNDVLFIIIIILLVLISTKILQINKQQRFTVALLKMWNLVLNIAVRDSLNTFWVRIYFIGIFLFFTVITESYKGHLISFLTKPDRIEVNSMRNLIDLQYRIYIHEFFKHRPCCGFEKIPKKQLYYFNKDNCGEYIDAHTACITHDVKLRTIIEKNQIHVSKETFYTYAVWMTSPNFPFKRRLDTAISHYSQNGVINYWYQRDWERKLKKLRSIEADEVEAQFRPIELDDLLFAFKFLIIGLSCSFVIFIIEISRR